MIDVAIHRSILQIVDTISISAVATPICLVSRNSGLVTNDNQEGGMVGIVSILDVCLNGRGRSAAGNRIDVHIDTLLLLPSQPVLESRAVLVVLGGYDKHLHGRAIQIGMVAVGIQNSSAVEQGLIDTGEIRTISVNQHLLGGLGVGSVERYLHLDVVEHAEGVVDGVVADGLNGHLAQLDATHGAHYLDDGRGFATKATCGLVGGFVHDERRVLGFLVLAERRLTGHQSFDAEIREFVISGGIAGHRDGGVSAEGNRNEFVHDGDLRLAFVAADDGVGHGEFGEGASFCFDFVGFKAGERESGLEAGVVAFHTFRLVCRAELDLVLRHGGCADDEAEQQE